MRLKEKDQSSQDYAWTTFWRLFKAGRQKQIPQISTRVKKNPAVYNMDNILNLKQQRTRAHSGFV